MQHTFFSGFFWRFRFSVFFKKPPHPTIIMVKNSIYTTSVTIWCQIVSEESVSETEMQDKSHEDILHCNMLAMMKNVAPIVAENWI
jgi:hypothetical protein